MDESGSNIARSGLIKNRSKTSKVSDMEKTRFDDRRNMIEYRDRFRADETGDKESWREKGSQFWKVIWQDV